MAMHVQLQIARSKFMTKLRICSSILSLGLFAIGPVAMAQEFSTTPKHETLDEAIRFEKYKIAAGDAQARKDAAEDARNHKAPAATQAQKSDKTNQVVSKKPNQNVSTNRQVK
jgi:hypothetical protein